jgi:hypothetical protein
MGWFAFALALVLLGYTWWRVRRDWFAPGRELEQVVRALNEGRAPRTFLVGGSACLRGTALALEQLALRESALRVRAPGRRVRCAGDRRRPGRRNPSRRW